MKSALTFTHAVAALAALLLVGVGDSARRAYGMPFPSALFTAEGRFAAVFLPDWGVAGAPIAHGDLVLAVDGVPVAPHAGEPPGRAVYRLVSERSRAGAQHVTVAYLRDGSRRSLVLPVRRVGPRELWFFALLVPLAGAIYLASGLLVHRLAGRHPAGRAYLLSCCATFVTLAASFDYVTTARLQPLFPVSAGLVSLALVWTVYAFPQRPLRARPERALRAALLALAAVVAWAVAAALGVDPRVLRLVTWVAGFAGLLVLGAALASRLGYTTHAARSPRFAVGWILAIVPVCWGSLLFGLARGGDAQHLLAPFVFLAVPMSVDYSLLRQHVLDVPGDRLLRILAASTALWALLIGATVGWAVGAMSLPVGTGAALPIVAGVAVVGAMLALAPRVLRGLYFSTTARFQPTVERLGDVLAEHTDRASIEAALSEHVTRLTTAEGVRVLGPDTLAGVHFADRDALAAGRHVVCGEESERALLVPMRCRAELQGVLSVPVLGDAAGHTGEDLALLGTVASLGAIALRHAAVVAELDALRRAEVGATRDDRDLAVGLLSAEVCHEVAYSLHYFRYLLRPVNAGHALGEKDVALGRDEVDRLERLLSSLRRVEVAPLARVEVRLLDPAERALGLLRDESRGRRVEVEISRGLTVMADPDALVQVFANLLRNALQAAGEGGAVGVRARVGAEGLVAEVWDTGPGVAPDLAARIFTPWVTTKPQGLGLGLAITERLLRAMGWTISLHREDARTVFRLRTPPERVAVPDGGASLRDETGGRATGPG